MQQILAGKRILKRLVGRGLLLSLFLLAACNSGSAEEVRTWRVMGNDLTQKQDYLNTVAAENSSEHQVLGGDPEQGIQTLQAYGCTACHTIPGVPGANSVVGPPLNRWAERRFIAGTLPNNSYNLVQWIRDPQAVEPGTVMPDLDVSEQDARDMAAYLYTLRQN